MPDERETIDYTETLEQAIRAQAVKPYEALVEAARNAEHARHGCDATRNPLSPCSCGAKAIMEALAALPAQPGPVCAECGGPIWRKDGEMWDWWHTDGHKDHRARISTDDPLHPLFRSAQAEELVEAGEPVCLCGHGQADHISPAIDLGVPVDGDACQMGQCPCREFRGQAGEQGAEVEMSSGQISKTSPYLKSEERGNGPVSGVLTGAPRAFVDDEDDPGCGVCGARPVIRGNQRPFLCEEHTGL